MEIELWAVRLRLRKPFKHARAERAETINVVARVRCGEVTGWGEGITRTYLTGETPEGALAFARGLAADVSHCVREDDLSSLERAVGFVRAHVCPPADDQSSNAARAALEIAFLDAAARRAGLPFWRIVDLILPAEALREVGPVRYGVVLSAEDISKVGRKAFLCRLYGFRDVKLKVGTGGDDVELVATVRAALGRRIDLRLDANNGWDRENAERVLSAVRGHRVSAVEEPLAVGDEEGLRRLRERLGMKVILDESFTRLADVDRIRREGTGDILNVRISKCGGFVRSLECIKRAREVGLGVQLGCLVGESSILSAAGRHLAQRVKDLAYLEGSYDRHLLRENVVRRDLTFGRGGRARPIGGAGLGIEVDEALVRRLAAEGGVIAG
ncbi:MAG: enolase C-terminal domain-like protein [Planctomycetota bacterium]